MSATDPGAVQAAAQQRARELDAEILRRIDAGAYAGYRGADAVLLDDVPESLIDQRDWALTVGRGLTPAGPRDWGEFSSPEAREAWRPIADALERGDEYVVEPGRRTAYSWTWKGGRETQTPRSLLEAIGLPSFKPLDPQQPVAGLPTWAWLAGGAALLLLAR